MAGLRITVEFVVEDGLSKRVYGRQLWTDAPPACPDVYAAIGRETLKRIVETTSMLATLTTHPEDEE